MFLYICLNNVTHYNMNKNKVNVEQEIFKLLIGNANGKLSEVNGVTPATLRLLKEGKGKTSIYNIFDALFQNGIKSVDFNTNHGVLTICSETRQVFSKPRKPRELKIK